MADEKPARKRREQPSLLELEERVKIAELHAREAEAKVRLNAARGQLAGNRKSRKMGKKA
jgi:hypothetical protein